MNRLLSLFVFSLSQLMFLAQAGWAADVPIPLQQVQEEETKYTLTLNTQPAKAGSFNRSSGETFTAGQSVYMYYYANTDYVFEYWQSGDSVVSRDRYFYFTMPDHDATLTAVFRFDPGNPGDPDAPDLSKKYALTLKTVPANAGSFNRNSGEQFTAGQNVYMYYNAKTDYVFDSWQSGDSIVSRDRYFYFTMPDHDATLTAKFNYQPGSPADPDTAQVYYTVTLETQPANAGSFSWNNTTQRVAGSSGYIYAYNKTDFIFREWQQDGQTVGTDRQYNFVMPAQNIKLVAVYDYNPSNPENPGKNYWNEETGEVIVDDFTPGNLNDAIYYATNGNYDAVQMITVGGPISQYDWGVVNYYSNCTFLDMSRTYGMTYVPSYNFYDNDVLTTVVLPAGIEKIDYYAFNNCSSLSSISIYASTPPEIGNRAFEGIADSIVYVPADAISLYQDAEGWKDFTILPLAKEVSTLEVNLPEGTDVSLYKDMFIELVNAKSGQKQRYVVTNRQTYTFNSLIHRTSYNIYLRNAQGDVLGEVDGIDIIDQDVSVTFPSLMVPRDLTLRVLTPSGEDVTSQTTITWFDHKDTYLTKGSTLTGQLEGVNVKYRVQLPQTLGMLYQLPTDVTCEVQATNSISLTLTDIPQTTISGVVRDVKTGQALSGATVAVSQMLNGLYSKSFTTKTDNKGQWSLQVYEAKTDITASMDNYVSKTQTFEMLVADGGDLQSPTEIPTFELKDINGTTISIALTYTDTNGETQEFYSDYANVAYTVYNETLQQTVTDANVQYPQIVLMEQLPAGTVLRVTATSKNQKFMPVTATAAVDSLDCASVTLPIKQLGGITASFRQTDNPSVTAILYNANGQLLKKYDYSSASLTISELQDGQYTLVTMASTQLFNSVGSIAQFAEAGLREGADYVKNTVTVKSGEMTAINNALIPFLDETKLYYTGDGTSITVNKTQITTGNYLTITGHLDFKAVYADQVSDVKLIVDLPEESAFVDNSVMRGAQTATYTYADGQVIVPLDYYSERVRFCFIPTAGGEFTATGSVQFTLDGKTITQPIGNANFTVKDLSITAPSTIAKTTMLVSGAAPGKSSVEIYDDGLLIGNTTALANGAWETTCELNEPYNLSTHSIYAKVTTKAGLELISETKQVVYDKNMIVPEKVTMLYYNPEFVGQYNIVFDLINGTVSPKSYYFFPYKSYPNWWGSGTEPKDFTFIADLSNNDSTVVNGVTIRVYTDNGYWRNLEAQYNTSMNRWVAVSQFTEEEAPVGVDVVISSLREVLLDDSYLQNEYSWLNSFDNITEKIDSIVVEKDVYEDLSDEEFLTYLHNQKDSILNIEEFDCNGLSEYTIIAEDGRTITVKMTSCSGLEESNFTNNEEYYNMLKSSGGSLYVKRTEDYADYIDFGNNVRMTLLIEGNETVVRSRRAIDGSFITTVSGYISTFGGLINSIDDQTRFLRNALGNMHKRFQMDYNTAMKGLEKYNEIVLSLQKRFLNASWHGDNTAVLEAELNGAYGMQKMYKEAAEAALKSINTIKTVLGKLASIISFTVNAKKGYDAMVEWRGILMNLQNNDCPGADALYAKAVSYTRRIFGFYYSAASADLASLISLKGKLTGVISLALFNISIHSSNWGEWMHNQWTHEIRMKIPTLKCNYKCPRCGKNPCECKDKCPRCGNRPCTCPDKCPRCGQNPCVCPPPLPRIDPEHDPSGYVYEGVASNRLQGVMASCYYKETVEDMYGDLHDNVVLWDAEEYAQKNPLFTDEYGMYRWDVPKGLWQVKFEKEGYQTTYSEWLPVPPPQLEVNIAMTQLLQPSVATAKAYDEGVEVTFDKYMNPESLTTDNIFVTRNGEKAEGVIELLNEEVAYEGQSQTFASKVRFTMPEGEELLSTDEVQLTVRKTVESYAGVQMENDYVQTFDVEPRVRLMAIDSLVNIGYGNERTLTVAALPVDASKGKKVTVKSLSTMIASIDAEELTLDENGQAELKVTGELPGSTVLSYHVEGTDVEGLTTVNVKDATLLVTMAPRASRVSGTEVYRGTEIRLTSETENAVIYYTLDGSCPCNTETAIKYNADEPIIIADDNVTIKAMAQGHDLAESDVSEFSYTLKKTTLGYQLPAGWTWISHNVESPVAAQAFQEGAERIVSQTQEVISDPQAGFIGTLHELQPATAYKVKQKAQNSVRLTGYEWNAVQNSVAVEAGWNWIGYPVNQTMTLQEALAYFTPNDGDYIVGQNGYSEYSDGAWHGTLEGMIPGAGYMYKSISQNEIPFNTTIVSTTASQLNKRSVLKNSPWAADKYAYPNVMPLTAHLYANGVRSVNDEYIVAAFADSECRGVGQWKENRLLMSIGGEGGEQLYFMAYNPQTEEMYSVAETMTFGVDNVGTWRMPFTLTIGSEATDINMLYQDVSISPHVAHDYIHVAAGGRQISRISLTDMSGRTVLNLSADHQEATVNIQTLPDGIYIVTVVADGRSNYQKIVKTSI